MRLSSRKKITLSLLLMLVSITGSAQHLVDFPKHIYCYQNFYMHKDFYCIDKTIEDYKDFLQESKLKNVQRAILSKELTGFFAQLFFSYPKQIYPTL